MSRRSAQLSFTGKGLKRPEDRFGGALLKGNPKTRRPLDSKLPVHLVLRTDRSVLRLPTHFRRVNRIVRHTADKYGVRIYEFANVGNHLHLLIRIGNLRNWPAFIRELTGQIAQTVGHRDSSGRFWLYRPFTRIVRSWKKAFQMACNYVHFNQLEAEGHIKRSEIKTFAQLRLIFGDTA